LVALNHFTVPIATSESPSNKRNDCRNVILQSISRRSDGKKPSLNGHSDGYPS
jgi:hypothetical protein